MESKEEYKINKIEGYEQYTVDTKGVIRNFLTGLEMKLNKKSGYYDVNLTKNNKNKTFRVHRLVALMFIPNPKNKPIINHIDGNKLNNNVENLEWSTYSENTKHYYESIGGKKNQSYKVVQFSFNNIEIARFKSFKQASEETKISKSIIKRSCDENITLGEYKWRYTEEYKSLFIDSTELKNKFINFDGYDNYMISRDGRVYGKTYRKLLKLRKQDDGYFSVRLYNNDGKQIQFFLHRLIAILFIPNPENKPQVDHIDGNKSNNDVSNLKWVNQSENIQKSYDKNERKANIHIIKYEKCMIGKEECLIEIDRFTSKADACRDAGFVQDGGGIDQRKLNRFIKDDNHPLYSWKIDEDKVDRIIHKNRGGRPVIQLSLDGKEIRKFNSIREAERYHDCGHIGDVCAGRAKTTGGFKWKYANDF